MVRNKKEEVPLLCRQELWTEAGRAAGTGTEV